MWVDRIKNRENVTVVKSKPGASSFDHSIMSPTYAPHIINEFNAHFKSMDAKR